MKGTTARILPLALLLVLVASACGGGSAPLDEVVAELRAQPAAQVRPPGQAATDLHAVPGLILATNSPSLQEVAGAPEGPGAVVLFVQPDGPSDGRDIEAGDLLVSIDGTSITNHEHAVALLRSRPGQNRQFTFHRAGEADELTISIEAAEPTGGAGAHLDRLLGDQPGNALLRYVRATDSERELEARLEDLQAALDQAPEFVEATTLRASLTWDQRPFARDAEQRGQLEDVAMRSWQRALDLDPRHTTTLVVRSGAHTDLGQANRGISDAERAISLDGTHPRAHWALARAQLALGNVDAAAGPARAAIEINPYTDLTYYRTLAAIFLELERPDDCTATTEAVIPFLESNTGADAQAFQAAADDLRELCS